MIFPNRNLNLQCKKNKKHKTMAITGGEESLLRVHCDMDGKHGKNIMMYKGPFGQSAIALFQTYCNQLLEENFFIKKKILSVAIELAQNINLYSVEKETTKDGKIEGYGFMSICRNIDGYSIISGNPAEKADAEKLTQRCDDINKADNEQLHKLKRKLWNMENPVPESANIGLVQSALIAGSKINYESAKTETGKYFITLELEIKVPKS